MRSCTTGRGAPSSTWKRNGNTTIANERAVRLDLAPQRPHLLEERAPAPPARAGSSGSSNSRSTLSISRPSAFTSSRTSAERS